MLYTIGGVVVVLGILGGILYYTKTHTAPLAATVATTTDATPGVVHGNGYTIEEVPVGTLESIAPDLDRKIVFGATVPQEIRKVLQAKVDATTARLKKDLTLSEDWYNLAIYYHEANDYDGARIVWEFLIKAVPENPVAYENLGKLYHYDLKLYVKAESYLKLGITKDPKNYDAYNELYLLYLYSYKQNTTAAVDILNTAAKALPTDYTPYYVLGTYYRDKGDTANAKSAFTKAMDRARAAANVNGIKIIGDELAKLP